MCKNVMVGIVGVECDFAILFVFICYNLMIRKQTGLFSEYEINATQLEGDVGWVREGGKAVGILSVG